MCGHPRAVVTERNRLLAEVDMLQVQARRLRMEHTNFWGARSDVHADRNAPAATATFAAEAPGEIEFGHRFPSTRPEPDYRRPGLN